MFLEGKIYKRSWIHDKYGGSRQSGICPSAKNPYIFIFSGATGGQYGYKDGWLNEEVYSYTGEGQHGNMEFTRGNLALKDSLLNKKRIFLFEYVARGMVRYLHEMKLLDFDYFQTEDLAGGMRIGIKFFFKPLNKNTYVIPSELKVSKSILEHKVKYRVNLPNITERNGLVTSRVGQGAYRKSILHRWKYSCAVTGFNDTRVLIASHILPWKNASDSQRLDVDNGILLSPDYDALFDRHLVSFDSTGKILIAADLSIEALKYLGITGNEKIKSLSEGNRNYLNIHNQNMT